MKNLLKIVLIVIMLISPVYAGSTDPGQSVYDGEWQITFTGCDGKTTVYDDCQISEFNGMFVTFTSSSRYEIKLPLTSVCSTTIMQRTR